MDANILKILSDAGGSIVSRIQSNLQSTGTNATGKTSRSLRYEIKENETITLSIFGKKYIGVVETGRKATPDYTKPSKQFVASIKEWMASKHVEGSPYALAKYIHQHGTKLKRAGGRTDIISNVINPTLTDQISKSILQYYVNILVTNVRQVYGNDNK